MPGGPVELGPARQRAVLVALAVDAGRPVPVETLIDRVWDDDPPAGVRAGLYSYLTRLRRLLVQAEPGGERARIVSRTGGYLLDLDPGRVDLHRFGVCWSRPAVSRTRRGLSVGLCKCLTGGHCQASSSRPGNMRSNWLRAGRQLPVPRLRPAVWLVWSTPRFRQPR
jgi:hypothetical protein